MAANIFVDPAIVATPDDADRDRIVAWLQNLEIWLNEALTARFTWLHSSVITALLDEHERFPSYERLRALQRTYHLDINPAMLARNVNTFFRDSAFDLGSKLDKSGYLAESARGSVVICPESIPARWPDFICASMHSLLVTCSVCKQDAHPFASAFSIATMKCPDHSQQITVSAILTSTIPELVGISDTIITQTFPLIFTPEDLLPQIDVLDLWRPEEDAGIVDAIKQQWRKDWGNETRIALAFCLGPRFRESVTAAGLDTNRVVLGKITRFAATVIAAQMHHVPGAKIHALRTTPAGDSPQRIRKRDQARAWRLDVTKHGAGWRLDYWHIPGPNGGSLEFSNVCKEADDTIYE
ncbi:MAG TPA: hypothetical protein VGF67_21575 [Ktedonobacteraceae bacterium]